MAVQAAAFERLLYLVEHSLVPLVVFVVREELLDVVDQLGVVPFHPDAVAEAGEEHHAEEHPVGHEHAVVLAPHGAVAEEREYKQNQPGNESDIRQSCNDWTFGYFYPMQINAAPDQEAADEDAKIGKPFRNQMNAPIHTAHVTTNYSTLPLRPVHMGMV